MDRTQIRQCENLKSPVGKVMLVQPPGAKNTLGALLAARAEMYGEDPFLLFRDEAISFARLYTWAGRMAAGLGRAGIGRGDRVALMLPNCPEFIALWFGAAFLGAIEVPINVMHMGDLLAYQIGFSDARILVADVRYLAQVAAVRSRLPNLELVVVRRDTNDQTPIPDLGPLPVVELTDWAGLQPVPPAPDVGPADPYLMGFTSGTTGQSKGALLPHNYGIFTAELMVEHIKYSRHDVLYSFLPLFHGNAQTLATLPALVAGCRLALGEGYSTGNFWSEIRRYKATITNVIGGLLWVLNKQPESPADRDHTLRCIVTAAVKDTTWEEFERRFGVQLHEGYGMTEVGTVLMQDRDRFRKGSVGRPARGYQVEIHDENDEAVGPGVAGEIVVRPLGPNLMMTGYYKMPEQTLASFRNLWFHTGDLGYQDAEGFFYFIDRAKDAIRRLGENISSQELESILNEHEAILESAAVGVASELGEEEVKVVVVLRPNHRLDPAELWNYCRQRMAKFMVPRYIEFRPELPKTPTNKIQKHVLKSEGVTGNTWDRLATG